MSILQDLNTEIKQKNKALRVQGLLKKRKETLEEFLIKFFKKWNEEKSTLYVDDKQLQCNPGKRRSIGDIFLICKHYYPHCTVRQVADIIYNKLFQEVPNFRSSICSQIKKRVFYKGDEEKESGIFNESAKDEYGLTVEQWKDNL